MRDDSSGLLCERSSALSVRLQIQQNEVLQRQLQGAFSYSLFQRLMAALQGAARLRKEQIAWVFEVTDRLSTIDQIPKRRALSIGSRFLRQNHSDWVQQHGGWDRQRLETETKGQNSQLWLDQRQLRITSSEASEEGVLPVKGEHGLTCTSTDLS
ncbi:unnamed protein product [Boreogadus saida]